MIGPLPHGVALEIDDDGVYGNVYVQCQWGCCRACEPYPPHDPPPEWRYIDDWFCPEHARMVLIEEGVQFFVVRPWAGEPDGVRRVALETGRPWTEGQERRLRMRPSGGCP